MSSKTGMREGTRAPIVLAATFTLGPVLDHLAHLSAQLAWPARLKAVPYGRFAAQLSDARGHFWAPASFRIILIRPSDLGDHANVSRSLIKDALACGDDGTTLRIIVGDKDQTQERDTLAAIRSVTAEKQHIDVLGAAELFDAFGVSDPHDEVTDRSGHLPYTDEAMAALSLGLGREIDSHMRPPVKMIAVDGDNTLWSGVLGEDGTSGVQIEEGHQKLQETLKDLADRGMIITLLTKNEQSDVQSLLSERRDFPLDLEDFFEIHAGWAEKSEVLASLASRQGVSQEAILFLDDSPVESARMRAAMPGVLTISPPTNDLTGKFYESLWPFDQNKTTRDDVARVRRLKEEAVRQDARQKSESIVDFFATLDLNISILNATSDDIIRLSQLSRRTNQFNSSLLRFTEADLIAHKLDEHALLRAISVSDRFGDYGLVGMVLGRIENSTLKIELFSLSCRVLGRGVEHYVIRQLMEECDVTTISIRHVTGPRNQPLRHFLEELAGGQIEDEGMIEVSKPQIQALQFDPSRENRGNEELVAPAIGNMVGRGQLYQTIAQQIHGRKPCADIFISQKKRPEFETPFVQPRGELETHIARIWQKVLGVTPVGREDDFTALGGKSLDLVRIHARLTRELNAEITLADLFRFSNIRELAKEMTVKIAPRLDRAAAMRNARQQRARRTS